MSFPEHPGWLEISIEVHPNAREAVSAFLFNIGCEGIVTETFQEQLIKAYLPFQKNQEDIQRRIDLFLEDLKEVFPEIGSLRYTLSRIEDQDWDLLWRDFFQPEQVIDGLLITPEWEPAPSSFDGHVIRMDPGPAFGTGQHPSTRMCLRALEKVHPQGSWSMLDVGTGSGILSIYGAMLGADRITAIDIDPEAIRWAKRNIRLNDLSDKIELSLRPIEEWADSFFLITANLILSTILDITSHLSRVLIPEGWLILSGILKDQIEEVEKGIFKYGLHKKQVLLEEEWACLVLKKSVTNMGE